MWEWAIKACAGKVAVATLQAIVAVESGGHPYAIRDDSTGESLFPLTRQEALATAHERLNQGHQLDLGLAQINSANLGRLDASLEDMFEPCLNLRAAETILVGDFERATLQVGSAAALDATLSAYNTGSLTRGITNGYVQEIASAAAGRSTSSEGSIVPGLSEGAQNQNPADLAEQLPALLRGTPAEGVVAVVPSRPDTTAQWPGTSSDKRNGSENSKSFVIDVPDGNESPAGDGFHVF
jgi:type IV secretion system protein VirB1